VFVVLIVFELVCELSVCDLICVRLVCVLYGGVSVFV